MSKLEAEVRRLALGFASSLSHLARAAAREMVERALESAATDRRRTRTFQARNVEEPFLQLLGRLERGARPPLSRVRREFERLYIERALEESDGNITRAARALGVTRQQLQRTMQRYGRRGRGKRRR